MSEHWYHMTCIKTVTTIIFGVACSTAGEATTLWQKAPLFTFMVQCQLTEKFIIILSHLVYTTTVPTILYLDKSTLKKNKKKQNPG